MWMMLLTSRIAAMAYATCAILLGVMSAVLLIERNDARGQIVTLTNSVGQLKGSLEFQNAQIQQLADLGVKKQKEAQSALQAATAVAKAGAITIAEIATLPATGDPAKTCLANSADDILLEHLK